MFRTWLSRLAVLTVLLATEAGFAQRLETAAAFDGYVAQAEARIGNGRSSAKYFLSLESLSAAQLDELMSRLRRGEVVIEKFGNTPEEIPGGLIHDWVGAVFVPGATVSRVIDMVRDYDHLARYYSPDVMQSRLVSARGDDLHVFMRLRKQKVVTVVLDTEYDVHYGRLDAAHQYSTSRSTRVAEVEDAGSADEHALPAGRDHGYMWRLNSYWAFEQVEGGVLVECEAISLTRDIPAGLNWVVGPFVNSIPRESLQSTLNATRAALNEKTLSGKALVTQK
jgi:hypothetical protein